MNLKFKTAVFTLLFPIITQAQIFYTLKMENPEQHYFHVSIDLKNNSEKQVDFVLPAWSPGRYTINDFAVNVTRVFAMSGNKMLSVEKTDKQTWRVITKGAKDIQFSYDVYANNLNGTFSVLDADHANYNGPSIYMFVDGKRNQKAKLKINPYGDWKICNGYTKSENQTEFDFANYDMMIDTPTEIGHFIMHTFDVNGKLYRIMLHEESGDTTNAADFFGKVEQIVKAQHAFMPKLDLEQYTFLVSFSMKPNTFSDGMEHLNSTQVIIKGELSNPKNERSGLTTVAHEHFHVWNVKRLRPVGVGPHELKKELYTKSLWFSEGFTEYYENVSLARSGVFSLEDFRSAAEGYLNSYMNNDGRKVRTTEQSSWDTWFWKTVRYETDLSDQWYSYYSQGAVLGIMIDLKLRKESNGKVSVDDLMKEMYRKFYESEKGDWYFKGKPFNEVDILTALEKISGKSWKEFWNSYITGTKELNFNDFLPFAGLNYKTEMTGLAELGMRTNANSQGFLTVSDVVQNSDASNAKLQSGDIIIAVNGKSAINHKLDDLLPEFKKGDSISFTVTRNDQLMEISVLSTIEASKFKLEITDKENKELKNWLKL